jgi:hypothetical protein
MHPEFLADAGFVCDKLPRQLPRSDVICGILCIGWTGLASRVAVCLSVFDRGGRIM